MIYLTSSPFQQGIVIVDSPGIGESAIMDDTVKEYLPNAFAFIYVINSVHAGGIQRDRVRDSSNIVIMHVDVEMKASCLSF